MKNKITEEELADKVIKTLKEWKWEIYKEVQGPGGRCDIVAKNGSILWAVECKINFGIAVLEQAYNWKYYNKANYVSIALPKDVSFMGKEICSKFGIGVLVYSKYMDEVVEKKKPEFVRKIKPFELHEEQKDWGSAGTKEGGYFTPFKKTTRSLVEAVKRKNGIEYNQLIKTLDHHYGSLSSAKTCLKKFIETNVIPELELKIIDKKLCVFLKENK